VSVHAIGGFTAVSDEVPLPTSAEGHIALPRQRGKQRQRVSARFSDCGMNAIEQETLHCVAAEPHGTFLRVGVLEGQVERAYETMVLGRLRRGYRVIKLRGSLGTRIELCHLFVHVSFGTEVNVWMTPTQMRMQHFIEPRSSSNRGGSSARLSRVGSSSRLPGVNRGDPICPRGRTDPISSRNRRASGGAGPLGEIDEDGCGDANDGRLIENRMQRRASAVRFRDIVGRTELAEGTPDTPLET